MIRRDRPRLKSILIGKGHPRQLLSVRLFAGEGYNIYSKFMMTEQMIISLCIMNDILPNPSNSNSTRYKVLFLTIVKSLYCSVNIDIGIFLLTRKARRSSLEGFHRPIRHPHSKHPSTTKRKKCNQHAQRHNQRTKNVEHDSCKDVQFRTYHWKYNRVPFEPESCDNFIQSTINLFNS